MTMVQSSSCSMNDFLCAEHSKGRPHFIKNSSEEWRQNFGYPLERADGFPASVTYDRPCLDYLPKCKISIGDDKLQQMVTILDDMKMAVEGKPAESLVFMLTAADQVHFIRATTLAARADQTRLCNCLNSGVTGLCCLHVLKCD